MISVQLSAPAILERAANSQPRSEMLSRIFFMRAHT
jgi:hypothetical protein